MGDLKNILLEAGAVAGFAAIVGLSVLAMLYFSQARDVRRLREWAGRAPERDAEVGQVAAQLASQAVAQAYDAMAAMQAEQQAAQAQATEQEAIAAAVAQEWGGEQVLVDDGQVGDTQVAVDPLAPVEQTSDMTVEFDSLAAAAAIGAAAGETAGEIPPQDPGEVDLAAAANGELVDGQVDDQTDAGGAVETIEPAEPVDPSPVDSETRPSRLAPSTPAAARNTVVPLPPLNPLNPPVSGPLPPLHDLPAVAEAFGAGGTYVRGDRIEEDKGSGSRVFFGVAGVLILVVAVVFAATQLLGGDKKSSSSTTASTPQSKPQAAVTPASGSNPEINRPAVTVSVLNGTRISGLAANVGEQVDKAGFTLGTVANRGDNQQYIESVVYYTPGNKLEAQEVAKELAMKRIKPIDALTAAPAGNAMVVVVVGADVEQ